MDTTKLYIEMCEKAKEIQQKWKPRVGDYIFVKRGGAIFEDEGVALVNYKKGEFEYAWFLNSREVRYLLTTPSPQLLIWLPRQDQLQEMLLPQYKEEYCGDPDDIESCGLIYIPLFEDFESFWAWQFDYLEPIDQSPEKAWLAFVMYKKYNKIWDDKKKEWVDVKHRR